MSVKIILIASFACVLAVVLAGCSDESGDKSGMFEQKRAEALEEKKTADFLLGEEYYTAAGEHYKAVVNKANYALNLKNGDEEMLRLLEEAAEKLRSEEIKEGGEGKIRIGERWVKPEEYLAEKFREAGGAAGEFEQQWKLLIKEIGITPEKAAETGSGKAIIASGKKALPQLVEKMRSGGFEGGIAARLVFAMPERDDEFYCVLLVFMKSDSQEVRALCANAAAGFPRKGTTVALAEMLSDFNKATVAAAVKSIVLLGSPLGWHLFEEKMNDPFGHVVVKEQILDNLYLYKDERAAEALAQAVKLPEGTLVKAAARSLLKMESEKVAPALLTVLRRADELKIKDDETLIPAMKIVAAAKLSGAVNVLAGIFTNVSFSLDARKAAVDAIGDIGDDAALDRLSFLIHEREETYKDLWRHAANVVKRLKNPRVMQNLIADLSSDSPETVQRSAEVLGMCQDEAAVGPLDAALSRNAVKAARPAILKALAFIGSNAAMEKILSVLKRGDTVEIITNNYIDNVLDGIQNEAAFRALFKGAGDCPDTIRERIFELVGKGQLSMAEGPLLDVASDPNLPAALRFDAIGAIIPYLSKLSNSQRKDLSIVVRGNITILQKQRDPSLFRDAYDAVKDYAEPEMVPFFIALLRDNPNWQMKHLSAKFLRETFFRRVANVDPYLGQLAQLCVEFRKSGDYYIALMLADFTPKFQDERSKINEAMMTEFKELLDPARHPLQDRLGRPLSSLVELLGENYRQIDLPVSPSSGAPKPSKYRYLHFAEKSVMLLVSMERGREDEVSAIVYLPGFSQKLYGISIGDGLRSFMRLRDPEKPGTLFYDRVYNGYIIPFPDLQGSDKRKKNLAFVIEEKSDGEAVIKYMVEFMGERLHAEDVDTIYSVMQGILHD